MPVVTITGRVGSPARELGLAVAKLLGSDYVDHEILAEASRRSGAPIEAVALKDERAAGGRERLGRFFQTFLEKSAAAGSAGDPFLGPTGVEVLLSKSMAEAAQPTESGAQELDDKRYVELITEVIQDLAQGGNVVLIGRGSHVILKELPNSIHVFVVSSQEERFRQTEIREGLPPEAAAKFVKETESQRVAYYKKLFKVDAQDPDLFHLFLNSDRLGTDHAARIIADSAREMDRQLVGA